MGRHRNSQGRTPPCRRSPGFSDSGGRQRTVRGLLAPDHRISCPRSIWGSLLQELDRRGARSHEAGAFLLGEYAKRCAEVKDVVFYDDLDPMAYDTGVCVLDGEAFGRLWCLCRERAVSVVGDIHTHPGSARQSHSDRTNPMIARAGHFAVIVPNYAIPPLREELIGVYEYRGSHDWTEYRDKQAKSILYTGYWS
jgi:proteasome lid subunit RPN8/RPN11